MTDRYYAYTVVLDRDIRDDDAEAITNAIMMVKGVAKVTPHIADVAMHTAEVRARRAIAEKIYELWQNLH